MKTLSLIYDEHRKLPIVAIRFSYDDQLKSNLKQLPIVKWSKTKSCFYIENTLERKKELYAHLKKLAVKIDYSDLQSNSKKKDKNRIVLPVLHQQNQTEIQKFEKWLSQKRLSRNTVKTYVEVTVFFLRYTQLKKVNNFSSKLIEQFNYDFIYCGRKSVSYQNQCINGIKKFYEFKGYLVAEMNIVRPKKEKKLPVVLSTNEIKSILKNTINLKHKALLSLLYSGGLRIGEALNLKAKDVDSKRMLIHVRQSKGKKDRYTLLSTTFLTLLRDYYLVYKPKNYLFEGQNGEKYSNASAQAVLKRALRKSNIQKRVTLHTLRHSFATHLLENGTDIRYIQELLGHNSPKTTMIYTHVTDNSLKKIKNPFDDL